MPFLPPNQQRQSTEGIKDRTCSSGDMHEDKRTQTNTQIDMLIAIFSHPYRGRNNKHSTKWGQIFRGVTQPSGAPVTFLGQGPFSLILNKIELSGAPYHQWGPPSLDAAATPSLRHCHPRQRHDLIGCSETRSVGAQRVLNTCSNTAVHCGIRELIFYLFKRQRQRAQATYMPVKSSTIRPMHDSTK